MSPRNLFFALLLTYTFPFASAAFALGTVSGQFTDARSGAPVPGVQVELGRVIFGGFDPTGQQTVSDATGHYQMAIPTSSAYVLRVTPATPLLSGYWPNILCRAGTQCAFPGVGNVAVAEGGNFAADMSLTTPGSLAGRLTREFGGAPISGVTVRLDRAGQMGFATVQVQTDPQGNYEANGLPPGAYRVYVENDPSYRSEIYDNVPCTSACSTGTPGETLVSVTADQVQNRIDIALSRAGEIAGYIRNQGASALYASVGLRLERLVDANWVTQDAQIVPAGSSNFAFAALPSGTYRLATYTNGLVYNNLVYADVDCAADECTAAERAGGTLIELLPGESIVLNPIELQPAASILACVRDAQTAMPVPGAHVIAYSPTPLPIAGYVDYNSEIAGDDGCARIDYLASAPNGLRLRTVNGGGYLDQIYGGSTCAGNQCNLASGTLVPLGHDQNLQGINFVLTRGASISGTLLARNGGPGVPNAWIELVGANGLSVRYNDLQQVRTPINGSFRSFALADGTYTLRAWLSNENNQYRSYTYPGGPLTINQGNSVEGIVLVLEGETQHYSGFENP